MMGTINMLEASRYNKIKKFIYAIYHVTAKQKKRLKKVMQ